MVAANGCRADGSPWYKSEGDGNRMTNPWSEGDGSRMTYPWYKEAHHDLHV
jgi:hypothetical protein